MAVTKSPSMPELAASIAKTITDAAKSSAAVMTSSPSRWPRISSFLKLLTLRFEDLSLLMSAFLPAHHLDKDPAEEIFNAAAITLPDSLTTTRTASETAASTRFSTLPRRHVATMAPLSSLAKAARELKTRVLVNSTSDLYQLSFIQQTFFNLNFLENLKMV